MAERRMISKKVVCQDSFISLSDKARLVYYSLLTEADDDGFIGNTRVVLSLNNANKKSIDALCDKGFLIRFSSGVTVIRHWKIHNLIQKDRYKKTIYLEELASLEYDICGAYVLRIDSAEALGRICNTKG